MMPTFGFSVGDFISAIGLITKVSKALKDKCGASAEYQHIRLELEALERTLRHLQALQPSRSNQDHVNAIRGMALTCQIPLQEFLTKIERYEASLGSFSTLNRASLKSVGRKSRWALFITDEVAKLRTAITAKVLSINLLLSTHASESLSRLEEQAHRSHATSLAHILEQRIGLTRLQDKLTSVQGAVQEHAKKQMDSNQALTKKVDDATTTLQQVSSNTESINNTVMSFRSLGVQLIRMINHLPLQVRETLEQVVRSNLQMYEMLRTIHSNILQSHGRQPGSGDTFRFEDVLGRSTDLPYVYFGNIEMFNCFLEQQFKGVPGEQKVLDRRYLILDKGEEPVNEEEWGMTVFPGSNLVMSILIDQLAHQDDQDRCPRCGGLGRAHPNRHRRTFKICDECNLEFSSKPEHLGHQLRNDSDEERIEESGSTPRKSQNKEQSRKSTKKEQPTGESEFWGQGGKKNMEPSDETRRELRVFKRVHLQVQAMSEFLRRISAFDTTHFHRFDLMHTQAKFPEAEEYLTERLGSAISRRRQYLQYRRAHHQKLMRMVVTIPANIPTPSPKRHSSVDKLTDYEDTRMYMDPLGPRLPPFYKIADKGGIFECPVCYSIVSIQTERAWRKHVFRDLHPYVCVFRDCLTPDTLFKSQNEWHDHNVEMHGQPRKADSTPVSCDLCKRTLVGKTVRRHLASHLEELAIFALPSQQEEVYTDSESETGIGTDTDSRPGPQPSPNTMVPSARDGG